MENFLGSFLSNEFFVPFLESTYSFLSLNEVKVIDLGRSKPNNAKHH